MWEAVERRPRRSATTPKAINHFTKEIKEKLCTNQARLVPWDAIKDNLPPQLKISPIPAIPHKSKAFRSILDLSFRLRLKNGGVLAAVNNTTVMRAPKGAIDQIGECLSQIVHAFAEASEDAKIFMAKWDIKDGFWCTWPNSSRLRIRGNLTYPRSHNMYTPKANRSSAGQAFGDSALFVTAGSSNTGDTR
jgi:hypothetical protein